MEKENIDILRKVLWFEKDVCNSSFFADLEPKREVNENPRYISGVFYSEKCGKDIQHESGLEEKFFKKLEQNKRVLYYWHQPITVPYWRGKIKTHTTPDAGIILEGLKVVIVEVKPLAGMLDYKVQMKVEGLLKYCSENGCGFLLTDGKDTLEKIRKVKCNQKLEKELLQLLENRSILKRECKELMVKHNATQNELLKIIFKNQLRYRPFPFKLENARYKNDVFYQVFYEKKKYEDLVEERFETLFNTR